MTCWQKAWHSDSDLSLRREIFLHITKLVQKHGWETKMPSIANNFEAALYADAESKDEYGNLNTLERRVGVLMLHYWHKTTQLGSFQGSVFSDVSCVASGSLTHTSPGVAQILSNSSGSIVLPNEGSASMPLAYNISNHISMAGYDKSLLAPTRGQPPSSGFNTFNHENKNFMSDSSMQKAGSRMIPTPGLSTNGDLSSNTMILYGAVDGSFNNAHQKLFNSGATGAGVAKFQRVGLLKSNADSMSTGVTNCPQSLRPNQLFTNIGGTVNGTSHDAIVNPDFIQVKSPFSLSIDQSLSQQQHGVVGVDIFGANAEKSNLGNFGKFPVQICANSSSVAAVTANSFSSLLSSEHSDANLLQQFLAQHSAQSSAPPNSPTFSVVSQEHQQPGRTLVIPNQLDYKGCEAYLSNCVSPLLSSSVQSVSTDLHAAHDSLLQRSNQVPYVQQHHCHQKQQQQHQYQQEAVTFENKEKIWITVDAGNGSLTQLETRNSQTRCPQPHVVAIDQHSEQTCQDSGADTGQSEVVSNDDSLTAHHGSKDPCKQDHATFVKQQQWLLLMFWHVSRCTDPKKCNVSKCEAGRLYWNHVTTCQKNPCKCANTKQLLRHHHKCRNAKCIICGPVRSYLSPQAVAARCKLKKTQAKQPANSYTGSPSTNEADSPPVKRSKVDVMPGAAFHPQHEAHLSVSEGGSLEQACIKSTLLSKDGSILNGRVCEFAEALSSKIESPIESSVSAGSQSLNGQGTQALETYCSPLKVRANPEPGNREQNAFLPNVRAVMPSDSTSFTKKQISGITYLECLTSEQIRKHICSLRKWIGQSKVKAERNQALERNMSPSACSACAAETLHFDPIPVFCTQCGCRIKRNAVYYASGLGDSMLVFCGPCYSSIRNDTVESDGVKVQKSSLEKKRNDEQRLEAWVECDKCKKWQHQICALFNARINKERSEYVCPDCCISEIERGERVPRPANTVLGAKDLPRTTLSDFVEERLACKLDHERSERAKAIGKCIDEVPTAEGLVVRVLSSVDKKLEVKPRFLEIFLQEDYPKDFIYKSKMLMLFQEIEGVEVCIFGMYVQEFGAESPAPNCRHVYLSYLDSVKYFRPDVKAVTGEALRTYVYHEILIAYLDYCKRRGFGSCYIWACPPLKGDDYILYCHPEIQKTPKTDKLREWYLSMIAKAKKENVVTANKNLYDFYFTSNDECKTKVTATRLPYFDGDYWPGAAEDILQQFQEEEEGIHSARRGKANKSASKRTSKTSAHADVTMNMSKDAQLMQKLGQTVVAMKEDFIMVHLHHACSRCRNFITSGHRWFCHTCGDNFQLCKECYGEHEQLCENERHPYGKRESHLLIAEEVRDIPANTVDRDEIMECEYFDNRQAFLSLCQGNQYQYDTLRRAKHSSLMILYHLHNPNAPAFVSSCTLCHIELEAGQGWKCNTCPDYDVCTGCYLGKEVKHPHKLIARTIPADQNLANMDDRTQRIVQLRMMLVVLVHCAKCNDTSCQFAKCKNMKDLFRHGYTCHKRAAGGCPLCKRMWFLLTAHARSCKESVCTVPRCKDIRLHLSRAQQQQESRRRAAFNEMIRQRAAEAGGAH